MRKRGPSSCEPVQGFEEWGRGGKEEEEKKIGEMVLEPEFNGSARLVQRTLRREGKLKWLLFLDLGANGKSLFTGKEEERGGGVGT